jgi:hypothetical protein
LCEQLRPGEAVDAVRDGADVSSVLASSHRRETQPDRDGKQKTAA